MTPPSTRTSTMLVSSRSKTWQGCTHPSVAQTTTARGPRRRTGTRRWSRLGRRGRPCIEHDGGSSCCRPTYIGAAKVTLAEMLEGIPASVLLGSWPHQLLVGIRARLWLGDDAVWTAVVVGLWRFHSLMPKSRAVNACDGMLGTFVCTAVASALGARRARPTPTKVCTWSRPMVVNPSLGCVRTGMVTRRTEELVWEPHMDEESSERGGVAAVCCITNAMEHARQHIQQRSTSLCSIDSLHAMPQTVNFTYVHAHSPMPRLAPTWAVQRWPPPRWS